MQNADREEKERADARNALEEYVYEIRNHIAEGGALYDFVPSAQRSTFTQELDDTVDWLYGDGEDCNKQVSYNILCILIRNHCVWNMLIFIVKKWKQRNDLQ